MGEEPKFVNTKNAKIVSQQVKNYTSRRNLVEKWIELGTELAYLRILQQEDLIDAAN